MFWRTYATTVVLFMVAAATVAAHDSLSDRATLALRGTVTHSADVSIRASGADYVVRAVTNTPGGLSLSVELASGGPESALMINDVPARFNNGSAHVADVRPGAHNGADGAVAIAYAGSASPLVILDVAAR